MNPSDFTQDDLIAALRAERPAPRPDFTATLDARAAEGFHREGSLGELRRLLDRLPSGRHILMPALSGVAVAVVAVGIAVSQPEFGSGPDTGGGPVPTAVSGGAAIDAVPPSAPAASAPPPPAPAARESLRYQEARRSTGAAQLGAAQLAPPALRDTTLSTRRARSVERSAQVTLATQPGKVETVADEVVRVVDRHHGIVSSSSVTGGDAVGAGAQFQLMIPGDQLQAALADLSGLAHVRSRTEGSLDITKPVVSAGARLKAAQKRRDDLLRQLAAASAPTEIAALRYRVRIADSEIRSAQRQLTSLQARVRYSRVDVSIVGDESAAGSWGLADAVDDAARVLTVIAGSALVGLAVLVPLGLLGSITWLGYATLRRRERERALDQPS